MLNLDALCVSSMPPMQDLWRGQNFARALDESPIMTDPVEIDVNSIRLPSDRGNRADGMATYIGRYRSLVLKLEGI